MNSSLSTHSVNVAYKGFFQELTETPQRDEAEALSAS